MSSEGEKTELPRPIVSAIEGIRGQINRHVLIDAAQCAAFAVVIVGWPVAVGLYLAGQSLLWGLAVGVLGAIVVFWRELRRRYDSLDAALLLDRLLQSHDRFSTAYQFSRLESP